VPGFSSRGGLTLIEALHLRELADLPKQGHYAQRRHGVSSFRSLWAGSKLSFFAKNLVS